MSYEPRDEQIRARARSIGAGGGGWGKAVVGFAFAILFIFGGAFILVPDQLRELIFGTSIAKEFQETSTIDPGLSTEFKSPEPVADLQEISVVMPEPEPEEEPKEVFTKPSAEELERLNALQNQLNELLAAQGERGVDPAELEQLLDAQAERLKAEFGQQQRLTEEIFEERLRNASLAAIPAGPSVEQIAEQERLQREAEERARLSEIEQEQISSPALLFDQGGTGSASAGTAGGPRALNDNEAFLNAASRAPHETVRASSIPNPSRTIVQGTIVEAVLETAISTELPGTLRAVTSVDVYSYDGQNVLLPRGSRLIGTYSSDISIAQRRVLIAWNRAVTPDGTSVALGGIGGDSLGRSGQTGFVDTRFGVRFGTAALISVLGVAPTVLIDDDAGEVEQQIITDVSRDLRNTTASILDDYLSLPPVIYVDQGTEMTVFVNRDLVI